MDLISVIIPVYRVEPYLNQCIESVIAQTYNHLEIILIDDGSPDACPQICDTYAAKDARIKVVHKKNGGLSDARNTGLQIATGDWIVFVDSDDYIAPTMLQSLYNAAVSQNADMAVCSASFFNSKGNWTPDWFHVEPGIFHGLDILMLGHIPTSLVVAWNKLYRREVFSSIRYPVGRIHEDEAIAHKILGVCDKIACIDSKLYHYRQNPEGITKKAFSVKRLDIILAMADRVMYYNNCGLSRWSGPVLNDFFWHIVDKFFQVEMNCENRKKHQDCLRAARRLLPNYLRSRSATSIEKAGYCVFCFSPKLYNEIFNKLSIDSSHNQIP